MRKHAEASISLAAKRKAESDRNTRRCTCCTCERSERERESLNRSRSQGDPRGRIYREITSIDPRNGSILAIPKREWWKEGLNLASIVDKLRIKLRVECRFKISLSRTLIEIIIQFLFSLALWREAREKGSNGESSGIIIIEISDRDLHFFSLVLYRVNYNGNFFNSLTARAGTKLIKNNHKLLLITLIILTNLNGYHLFNKIF